MSIAKNQAAFLNSKLATSLGSSDYGDGIANAIDQVLLNASEIWREQLKKNLAESKSYATGNLSQSIRGNVSEYADTVSFKLYIEDYYINVNDGRKGTRQSFKDNKAFMIGTRKGKAKLPPFQPISDWVRAKGLRPKGEGFRTAQTSRVSDKLKKARLVDLIRYGIKKNGVEPTYFYTQVINDESIKLLKEQILKATGKALVVDIKRYKE